MSEPLTCEMEYLAHDPIKPPFQGPPYRIACGRKGFAVDSFWDECIEGGRAIVVCRKCLVDAWEGMQPMAKQGEATWEGLGSPARFFRIDAISLDGNWELG